VSEPTAPAVPLDLRLATPANWFDIDLNPSTSAASIARLVEERSGSDPDQADTRRQLVRTLRKATGDAREQDAIFASVLSDVIEGRPVAASVIVSLAHDGSPAPGDVKARVTALGARLAQPGGPIAGAATTTKELRAGWSVRARRRMSVEPPGLEGHPVEVESVQYFVPLPGSTDLVLLSFSTPNLGLADAMVELFDAMAESLQWRW
jgi:hypothetical protein